MTSFNAKIDRFRTRDNCREKRKSGIVTVLSLPCTEREAGKSRHFTLARETKSRRTSSPTPWHYSVDVFVRRTNVGREEIG